jgi:hypothetical protein
MTLVGRVTLVYFAISEREQTFSNDGSINSSFDVIWLDNRIIVEDSNLICRTVTLKSVWYVFKTDLFDLVIFVHCWILIPQRLLRHPIRAAVGCHSVAIDKGVKGSAIFPAIQHFDTRQNDPLFV